MKEIEFDLLTEPWIRVRLKDNTVQEVSLTEALVSAQDYVDLAGEMPTQDAAVLRLLLAVLFTVFSRVNVKGEPEPLEKRGQTLRRWSELWQLGHFPAEPIRDYLEQWKDRFWLFHPTHPFWQVPEARIGTEYGAAKLNGGSRYSWNDYSRQNHCIERIKIHSWHRYGCWRSNFCNDGSSTDNSTGQYIYRFDDQHCKR